MRSREEQYIKQCFVIHLRKVLWKKISPWERVLIVEIKELHLEKYSSGTLYTSWSSVKSLYAFLCTLIPVERGGTAASDSSHIDVYTQFEFKF